jgi:hypothetical protein
MDFKLSYRERIDLINILEDSIEVSKARVELFKDDEAHILFEQELERKETIVDVLTRMIKEGRL